VGLAAKKDNLTAGRILEVSDDGKSRKVLVDGQSLPDGIDYDAESKRMFWTCMGDPRKNDGEVFSANLDGTDVRSIVPKGAVNTPKQLVVEPKTKKLYFCDREGMRVIRCDYDGGDLEVLVQNGDWKVEGTEDKLKWCVGIAVSPKLGKFYWTQKGSSKSGEGRIFCADIDGPARRAQQQLVLDNLPEPIDLEIDEVTDTLYWTDRGELPRGNTVNKARLDPATGMVVPDENGDKSYRILHSHFNETIGLKLDTNARCVYVTDLGGSIYRCSLDGGEKRRIFTEEDGALTGITVL
jgi:sugar lactone lactonase YvrE